MDSSPATSPDQPSSEKITTFAELSIEVKGAVDAIPNLSESQRRSIATRVLRAHLRSKEDVTQAQIYETLKSVCEELGIEQEIPEPAPALIMKPMRKVTKIKAKGILEGESSEDEESATG
ncbi:hypothetical protein ACFL3C_03560 [Patescibacteria group bacterium]